MDARYWIVDIRCWMLDAGCWMLGERKHPESSIQHPASRIEHPESSIQHRASSIQHQASSIKTGFTLIEVTIVIFIMVMMTSMTVPWMKTFAETSRLRSTARSIRSLMAFAQNCAVTQRTEYVVMFDSEEREYWLTLLEFLDQESGGVVIDSSRISLSESLASLSEPDEDSTDVQEEEEEEIEGAYSRTGGILGIPRPLPNSISIAQMSSPRTMNGGGGEVEYIIFYPDGTAEEFEIYLQSQSGRVFLLNVTQATGRAAIQELTVEEAAELELETTEQD